MTRKKDNRIPTIDDYRAYNGAHCGSLWASLSDTWTCPGCGRTKFQIMRWTLRYRTYNPVPTDPYEGWMAGLHRHHDHGWGYGDPNARFQMTTICDHCNCVDAQVRRRYWQIPEWFSFAPHEIRQIVTSQPHRSHILNYPLALTIFEQLYPLASSAILNLNQ